MRAGPLAALALLVAAGGPLSGGLGGGRALFSPVSLAHKPAQSAPLPGLTRTPQHRAAGNAVLSPIDDGGFLVGALLGATVAAATPSEAGFATSAALFAAALSHTARIASGPALRQPVNGSQHD